VRASESQLALAGFLLGLAAVAGCSSGGKGGLSPTDAGGTSAAGSTATAGTGVAGSTDAAGSTGTAGSAGAAGTTGVAGAGDAGSGAAGRGVAGATGTAGDGGAGAAGSGVAGTGAAGSGGAGVAGAGVDVTQVAPTKGCGMEPTGLTPGTLVQQTMQTMGAKDTMCADSKCGAWSFLREYFVRLPTGYDKNKAYPLLIEGPGCGGKGNNLYPLPALDASAIRVGLSPSVDAQKFHATNPGQGCFDDKEGDDSIEWVFYENLWDKLAGQICFDKNRVFAAGNSSGAWLANELGCKYAGDAVHPIRAVMPNQGGLPTDPRYVPTCTKKPLAGMWIDELGQVTAFVSDIVAMNRAFTVNGCTPAGVSYATVMFDPFPIGGGNSDTTCKKAQGCPALAPIVVCSIAGNAHASHDTVVTPGWPTFMALFEKAPLLAPSP
jgi:hypothetical protein